MSSKQSNENYGKFWVTHVGSVLFHPFSVARTLMQLGYEPNEPQYGHTILSLVGLGKQVQRYPSVFAYLGQVKIDFGGWYYVFTTGFCAKVTNTILSDGIAKFIDDRFLVPSKDADDGDNGSWLNAMNGRDLFERCCIASVSKAVGLIVAYPFRTVMVHQIAAFVAHDATFRGNLFQVFKEIVDEKGFFGLFDGFRYLLIGDLLALWGTGLLAFVLRKFVVNDGASTDLRNATPLLSSFLVSSYTYRYGVVSSVVSISTSRLTLSIPYNNSKEAWVALKLAGELNRGSSLFLRSVPVRSFT